jgi:HEAT repeat protein
MHLAAPLFSLEELIEPPRLLAPPARVEPGATPRADDIVSLTVPYTPAWPELASIYRAPTLGLPEALSGGTNIVVIGQPGCGKTVALAHLAIQVINRQLEAQALHNSIPFLVHIADVDLPLKNADDPLNSIIEIVAERAPVIDLPRTPTFVKTAFESGRALLLLDGLDELAPGPLREATEFLRVILKSFPRTRVVTTGAPEYIDGLIGLGFAPLAVAAWDDLSQDRLLARWSNLWARYVSLEAWANPGPQPVDSALLDTWLVTDNDGLSPLEYTLKIWGAYAGDTRGPRPADAIEMHIRRLVPSNVPAEALQAIGMQANINASAIFDSRMARDWVRSFELSEDESPPEGTGSALGVNVAASAGTAQELETGGGPDKEGSEATAPTPGKKKAVQIAAPRASLLGRLAESGLLSSHRNNRLRFAHPVFGALLAGKALAGYGSSEPLTSQPVWSGRTLAMRYYAAHGDAHGLYSALTNQEDPLLERGVLAAARWLRDAPRQPEWRTVLMPRLLEILQSDLPLGLRAQALTAIALSTDPSAPALFRQLLQVPAGDLRALAALGCGAVRDAKAVEALMNLLQDHDPLVNQAASLALVSIGAHAGLVALATILQHGNEGSRRAAAEALANNPVEGHETLREGATAPDILLRRAVIFGLARVNEPWATEMLQKLQVEDEQWVVRTLAVEFVEAGHQPSSHVPHKLTAPSETPWIIEFAGRYGMGVAPGHPATDLLLLALKSEKQEERHAALNYLRYTPSEGVLAALFNCVYSDDAGLREAAYYIVWEMSITGAKIPSPTQYGLG